VKSLATKHEQILKHIDGLPVGEKISVRQIARALSVSEGTAYRAIKEAENQGYVSSIERVGTIRIERKKKENIEKLTFAEVVNIVDGQVFGGRNGLHKTLNKFVIGAMEIEAMMRYIGPGNLLIVGNRTEAHKYALKAGAAVLITGGFDAEDRIKKLADELELPVISTSYDSFTVATMINRAIYDQLIKKEILLVEDILIPINETIFLYSRDLISDWLAHNKSTNHSRFPVVDEQMKIQGMVTSKDVLGQDKATSLDKVMTKNPVTVGLKTSVASSAHLMVWEGIELLPVINDHQILQGIISRQDVLKALQMSQRQPQVGETIDDTITSQLMMEDSKVKGDEIYRYGVTPQMTNYLGNISSGVITTIVTDAANRALRGYKRGDLVVENMTLYYIKPVQIDSILEVHPRVLEVGRKFGKVDVEVFNEGKIVVKAMMTCHLLDHS
jgi:predicted transcriptional regulator